MEIFPVVIMLEMCLNLLVSFKKIQVCYDYIWNIIEFGIILVSIFGGIVMHLHSWYLPYCTFYNTGVLTMCGSAAAL